MTTASVSASPEIPLQEIARAVRQIRFGSVEIVIHDSRIVQIERREKVRFDKGAGSNGSRSPHEPSSGFDR
jgi:hypothetical protein